MRGNRRELLVFTEQGPRTVSELRSLTGITDASSTTLQAFTYDKTGDRLSKAQTGQSTQTYAYSSPLTSHRLQSVAGVSRSYDANGNYTNAGAYTFDDSNRLSSAAGTPYAYSGRGERVSKGSGSTRTNFAYNESGQLVGEYDASGTMSREYVYLDGAPIGVAFGGNVYYIETDQLGTPREVIQPGATTAGDTVVWKWDYFANNSTFGENTPSVQAITFNLRFPGQYYDVETGLNYNYFRDYEPGTGRYVESDPIGLGGGLLTYSYVGDRPLTSRDRRGLLHYSDGFDQKSQHQLSNAANKIEHLLASNCNCDEGSCFPCELKTELQRKFVEVEVQMSIANWYQADDGTIRERCAFAQNGGSILHITQLGYVEPACPCLEALMFHELLHTVGLNHTPGNERDPNDPVNLPTRKCDLCIKGTEFPWQSQAY